MKEYEINGKKIELDTDKKYMDFYWHNNRGNLSQINLEGLLEAIQSGEIPIDDKLKENMKYLQRWETDAPRKRNLRELRKSGVIVLTTDALFEEDAGEEIINNLENTGIFAAYFLREIYRQE